MEKLCARCGKLKKMLSWETLCFQCLKEKSLEQQQENIRTCESADTLSDDYVICPYCGAAFEPIMGDDNYDDCFVDGESKHECAECGKTFILNTMVSFSWETEKECEQI